MSPDFELGIILASASDEAIASALADRPADLAMVRRLNQILPRETYPGIPEPREIHSRGENK